MSTPIALTLCALAALGTLFALPRSAPTAPVATPQPDVVAAAPAPAPAAAPLPVRRAAVVDPQQQRRMLLLPDGSLVPTLNGAIDAAPIADYWGPAPWSPIVGVRTSSAGVDWYEHENGSFSTTQMVLRPDLGRMAAMTRVAHPRSESTPTVGPDQRR